jgi:hypothetical protein
MNRILAANGLVHGKYADTYRKLLDETPPVSPKGTVHERIAELKTPINHAKCKRNQGAYTLSELEKILKAEGWDQDAQFRKYWEDYYAEKWGIRPDAPSG